jgi:hypothetical protein
VQGAGPPPPVRGGASSSDSNDLQAVVDSGTRIARYAVTRPSTGTTRLMISAPPQNRATQQEIDPADPTPRAPASLHCGSPRPAPRRRRARAESLSVSIHGARVCGVAGGVNDGRAGGGTRPRKPYGDGPRFNRADHREARYMTRPRPARSGDPAGRCQDRRRRPGAPDRDRRPRMPGRARSPPLLLRRLPIGRVPVEPAAPRWVYPYRDIDASSEV